MGNLTVKQIENAKPKDKPYKLMDGDGLQLRVPATYFLSLVTSN